MMGEDRSPCIGERCGRPALLTTALAVALTASGVFYLFICASEVARRRHRDPGRESEARKSFDFRDQGPLRFAVS